MIPTLRLRRVGRKALALVLAAIACRADVGYGGRSSAEWISQLRSADPTARVHAADALAKVLEIQPDSHDVVDALARALADTSDDVRLAAAAALTRKGVDILGALEGFHGLLHDSAHAQVRASMALIVGSLGIERGRLLIPVLREALRDSDVEVRATAIESLGMVGARDHELELELVQFANDKAPIVRLQVIQAMVNLRAGAPSTLAVARPALKDSSVSVRSAAAYALGALGLPALPALADLLNALDDPDPLVRTAAAFAIGSIGPAARPALPRLARHVRDSSAQVVRQAREAIAAIEQPARARQNREPTMQERCGLGSQSSARC